jgi:hypothetical protein
MLRHLRMSVRRRHMSRRVMIAATGMMRLIMLPLITATGIVRLIMLPLIIATSIVRLTLLPSIVVMNTPGLTLLPSTIDAMFIMAQTLLRSIIEATTIGGRGARLPSAPCRNIQHRRIQFRLRRRHRNVRRPNTRLMKKRVLSPRGRSAVRSHRTRRDVDTSAIGDIDGRPCRFEHAALTRLGGEPNLVW